MNVDLEDLRILVDARYQELEYLDDPDSLLDEDDRYWELSAHLGSTEFLGDSETRVSGEVRFNYHEMDHETFLDVVYPHTVDRLESEYGDEVDALLYYDPDLLEVP